MLIAAAHAVSEKCASNNRHRAANSQKPFDALPLLNAAYAAVDQTERQCKSKQKRKDVANKEQYLAP